MHTSCIRVLNFSTFLLQKTSSANARKPLQSTNRGNQDDGKSSIGKATVPAGPVFRCTERAEKRREVCVIKSFIFYIRKCEASLGENNVLTIVCSHLPIAVLHEVGGEAPSYGGREDSVGSQAEGNLS